MTNTNAIIAKRVDSGTPDTAEIQALAEAAGYTVVGEVTQVRSEDSNSYFGSGKLEELTTYVTETDAEIVVVDGELTPSQNQHLRESLPEGTQVHDRYRLVLEIFDEQANTHRAQLQVELARLRYDLPRMQETADEGWFNKRVEKGSPLYDAEDRIDALERKLDDLPDPADEFHKRRRQEGFDLVTIAGYTNAGKSTLLHRLADDLGLDDTTPDNSDRNATAAAEDRLFKTLETTTRRATLDGRPILLTDTVGFVADLPHWLVESFSETLSEAATADAIVLVVDASDSPDEFQEKLRVSLDVLDAQNVPQESIITVLNKVDLIDDEERDQRLTTASEFAPSPVAMSITDETNVEQLITRIRDQLPTERTEVTMPNGDEAMQIISWLYDRTNVSDVDYAGETVTVTFVSRPSIVEQAQAKVDAIDENPERKT